MIFLIDRLFTPINKVPKKSFNQGRGQSRSRGPRVGVSDRPSCQNPLNMLIEINHFSLWPDSDTSDTHVPIEMFLLREIVSFSAGCGRPSSIIAETSFIKHFPAWLEIVSKENKLRLEIIQLIPERAMLWRRNQTVQRGNERLEEINRLLINTSNFDECLWNEREFRAENVILYFVFR